MAEINLIAQVCMHNEVRKGNLDRCLDNLIRYCDRVIIWDDASDDDSVKVAEDYGCHVIRGEVNNQMEELAHKQAMLDAALSMGATHLFWLDCDEVLDRPGTLGGLRDLCMNWPDDLDAYSFPQVNLWRSQTWQRLDSLFTRARFVRLWRANPGISFDVRHGVHKRLYPITIETVREAPFSIIHYGFWDYKRMLTKIGADHLDANGIRSCAEFGLDRKGANWILDERECRCRKVEDREYPPGTLPPDIWAEPGPRKIQELAPHAQVQDEPEFPLVDSRAMACWDGLHEAGYHGQYCDIHERNTRYWEKSPKVFAELRRACLFSFDPRDRVIYDVACGGGWYMLDCIVNGAARVIGLEMGQPLVSMARASFRELGVPDDRYQLIDLFESPNGPTGLPKADIIYCLAMLMHIPFWQACRYFRWMRQSVAPAGEVHLQFYRQPGSTTTMFWDGFKGAVHGGDHVSNIRLHHELERAGLKVVETHVADAPLPVWEMYRCVPV